MNTSLDIEKQKYENLKKKAFEDKERCVEMELSINHFEDKINTQKVEIIELNLELEKERSKIEILEQNHSNLS